MNKTQKAIVAKVRIGHIEIEGLMLPDGSYAVAVSQVASLFQFDSNQASRTLKPLLGKDFQFDKVKSELNPKAVNIICIQDLEKIIVAFAKKGNNQAINLTIELLGLSLHQLFCDAFGVKFEQEERQNWLKTRMQSKAVRRTLTDAIKDWLDRTDASENTRKFLYSTVTDNINRGIFSRSAKKLKEDWGCNNPRDNMTADELRWVAEVEDLAMRLIDNHGFDPIASVKEALERLLIDKVGR